MSGPDKRRTYAMFAIVTLACALGNLTQTVMNSMLGGVQQTFGTPESVSQYLTTIYMLTIGITVPLVTHLSRKYAVRTLILVSLVFSLVGAVVGALAPGFIVLVLARILQAIGCGITLPLLQAIAMTRFPANKVGTAMGIAGIAMGFAPNIGPLIGGVLVNSLGWRSFFWMLSGAVLLLGLCTVAFVRKGEHAAENPHLDILSVVLSTFGFGGMLAAFSSIAYSPLTDVWIWVELVVGIVCTVLFIRRQRRIEHPLIHMEIFRSRTYVASFVAQNLLFASFMSITLILPLFVVNVQGLTPVDAGMIFLPNTVLAIVFNPVSGILYDKIGARPVVIAAAVILVAGSVPQAFMDAETPFWLIVVLQTLRGIGVSSLIGPLNSWGMHKLEPRFMIDASAFFTTVRQACASLGTALMMMLIALAGGALGYNLALGLSGLLSIGVLACAILFVKPQTS